GEARNRVSGGVGHGRLARHSGLCGTVGVGEPGPAVPRRQPFGAGAQCPARGVDPAASDAPYQQVWFPGVHGAVGGGGERRGLANIALDWIWDGARRAGLEFDTSPGSPAAALEADYRDVLVSSHANGVMGFLLHKLPEGDRLPGPAALHEVSSSARQRWKEDPANLPEGRAYRPVTLSAVADLLDKA